MLLVRIRRSLSELLSPNVCAACDTPLGDERLFCPACDDGSTVVLDRLSREFPVIAAAPYDGAIARAVTRMKYGGRPDLARPLARRILAALLAANVRGPASLVPVPLHVSRLCSRGFNQSALLAGHLSAELGWSFLPRALVRTHPTREQASLARRERLRNVALAIAARERVAGPVVLVDDVVTTGATAVACAAALLGAGASGVTIAAVARAGASEAALPVVSQRAAAIELR